MERVGRRSWRHAAALVGAAVGAFALGAALAELSHPGSVVARGAAGFALLLVLMLGYQLWVTRVVAAFARALFAPLGRALMRALRTQQAETLVAETTALRDRLRDPSVRDDLVRRIRARTRIFRTVGAAIGVPLGFALGIGGSRLGFPTTFTLYAAAAIWYGFVLSRLGWLGYLPLPEDLEA